jgi:hypothetical protein
LSIVFLIVIVLINSDNRALALQQVAGEIDVAVKPGESSSFQWGLLSDSEQEIEVQLRAEGDGSEFMLFPSSAVLSPGTLYWVNVNVTVPGDHLGSVELQPSLFATELGEQGGATVMNIQMQKVVKLTILPNPTPAGAPSVLSREYPQLVRVGGEEIQLLMQSTSTITDFELDEANKNVSFKVTGTGEGSTIVKIGSVLEGPYGVSVDGEMVYSHESIVSEDGVESIKINHDQDTHDITISGTSVVPEFSVPAIIMALTVALVIAGMKLRGRVDRLS